MKGSSQDVSIDSRPASARVEVRKRKGGSVSASGRTPLSTSLKRDSEYEVVVEADGYEAAKVWIRQEFEFWVLGNLLCGGLIGGAIDLITGAFWRLSPDELYVTLVPSSAVPVGAPGPGAPAVLPGGRASLAPPRLDGADPRERDGLVALFVARDDQGNLRMMTVPLIPKRL